MAAPVATLARCACKPRDDQADRVVFAEARQELVDSISASPSSRRNWLVSFVKRRPCAPLPSQRVDAKSTVSGHLPL
jgi:hypothetical protein